MLILLSILRHGIRATKLTPITIIMLNRRNKDRCMNGTKYAKDERETDFDI